MGAYDSPQMIQTRADQLAKNITTFYKAATGTADKLREVQEAKVEKAKKIKEQESLRASEENALNTMLNIGNAAKDIGYQPGMAINQQQLDNLNLYNKSGMYLQKSEDSDTKIDVFSGSSYKYSFDTTDPAFLQQLFKAAGVSNNYWNLYPGMSENTNTDNTQQNQTQGTPQQTGGAYDNIGQSN